MSKYENGPVKKVNGNRMSDNNKDKVAKDGPVKNA